MTIDIYEQSGWWVTNNTLHTQTADGKELYVLSGVVKLEDGFVGQTDAAWKVEHFRIHPAVAAPAGKRIIVHDSCPFVTVSSFFNEGQSINSGFAVDNFKFSTVGSGPQPLYGDFPIDVECAVRDSDAVIYRLAYTVTFTATYEQVPPGP